MGILVLAGLLVFNPEGPTVLRKIQPTLEHYNAAIKVFSEEPESLVFFIDQKGNYWVEGIYPDKKVVYVISPSDLKKIAVGVPMAGIGGGDFRALHILNQAILGLTVYSWALPRTLNFSDNRFSIMLGLSTPLIWFGINVSMTTNKTVTAAKAYAGLLGGFGGVVHGWTLFDSPRGVFPVSIAENLFDQYLATKLSLTPGIIQRKFNFGATGYYHAFLLSKFLNKSLEPPIRAIFSIAESYTALFLSKYAKYLTFGDALFELRLSILGAEAGPMILWSVNPDAPQKLFLTTSAVGLTLSQILGMQLSRKYDLSLTAAALNFILPYLVHSAIVGVGIFFIPETLWRYYPLVYITADGYLSWKMYQMFRKPAKHKKTSSLKISPFFGFSRINPKSPLFGFKVFMN